jgi:hypothetical protein
VGAPEGQRHEAWRFSARLRHPPSPSPVGTQAAIASVLSACAPSGLLEIGKDYFPGAEAPGSMPLPLRGGKAFQLRSLRRLYGSWHQGRLGATLAAYPVADGEAGPQVVMLDLASDFTRAPQASYPEFTDSCLFFYGVPHAEPHGLEVVYKVSCQVRASQKSLPHVPAWRKPPISDKLLFHSN